MRWGDIMITGLGVDIVEIHRIEEAINKNQKFLTRVFTESEIEYFHSRGSKYETLAGNFAAKEAVTKVLGTGLRKFHWSDIEILRDELGKPYVKLHNNAIEISEASNIDSIMVSISHCKEYAVANAIGMYKNEWRDVK